MEYSLGLVEVSALGNAIIMLDDMLKAADVEFVATERKLGGRLVTIVVRGELTSVKASVDAGVARATKDGCLKASQVIARPHHEIFKFLHLDEEEKKPNSEIAGTHVGAIKKLRLRLKNQKQLRNQQKRKRLRKQLPKRNRQQEDAVVRRKHNN